MNEPSFYWPWEPDAMAEKPMPDGLGLFDQAAYTAVRNLYAAHHRENLDRETASAEKKMVKRKYDQAIEREKFSSKMNIYYIKLHMQAEKAMIAVRKNPTPENALLLVDILDGIEKEWPHEA